MCPGGADFASLRGLAKGLAAVLHGYILARLLLSVGVALLLGDKFCSNSVFPRAFGTEMVRVKSMINMYNGQKRLSIRSKHQ
jgi:hypothetical protein